MKIYKKILPLLFAASTLQAANTSSHTQYPFGIFRADYEVKGSMMGVLNYPVRNYGIFIESQQFDEEQNTYMMKGKLNVEINALIRKLNFDLDITTLYDEQGNPLESAGVRRTNNNQMTNETKKLAEQLEQKGLIKNIEDITALYYQEYDYEQKIIRNTGLKDSEHTLDGKTFDLLTALMKYVSNIEQRALTETKKIFFYGGLHNMNIHKVDKETHTH